MDNTDDPLASLPPILREAIQMALTTFIQENLPSIYVMIIASLWLGISLSLFMALLYTSTSYSRRKPIFILCVIAVGFGTVPSILNLRLLIQTFVGVENGTLNLANDVKPYVLALAFFSFFSSLCVDSILLFRLVAVFPSSRLSRKRLGAIFGPLLAIKMGRIAAVVICIINYMKKARALPSDDPVALFLIVRTMPEPKAVWSLQLLDITMCSFLFLYRLQQIKPFSLRLSNNDSFSKRLRTLFLIATSNFVFPVIFVIIELVLMSGPLNYMALDAIGVSANNVEVIGVLFATIWASQTVGSWKNAQEENEATGATEGISFATRPVTFVSTRQTDVTDYSSDGLTTRGEMTGAYSISEASNIGRRVEKQETSVV